MVGWLFIHGTTELFAIGLASGAGLRIGTAIALLGRRGRRMDVCHQIVTADAARFATGGTLLSLWLADHYGRPGMRAWRVTLLPWCESP